MQILLACVKIMIEETEAAAPVVSEPRFLKDAERFALLMSQQSAEKLMGYLLLSSQCSFTYD